MPTPAPARSRPLLLPRVLLLWLSFFRLAAANAEAEHEYYTLRALPIPPSLILEVSGLASLPDGRLAVMTRRGELWIITAPHGPAPRYHRFASGLHEPLGLAWHQNAFYTAQRTELTALRDLDGDGIADEYRTVAKGWGVSGNYHEYAYGPEFDPGGNAWLTLNSTLGAKIVDADAWRGYALKVAPDGSWSPIAGGMRSPAGLGANAAGDLFFTDQQGNWVPTCSLHHLRQGAFFGHPDALQSSRLPGAPFPHPGDLPTNQLIPIAAQKIPHFNLPAVWFPYRKMGMSATDVACDSTQGKFGPFQNQLFVGEFTASAVHRVFLEKVRGRYQGACFPFRKGFQSGVLRLEFGSDGALYAGQSNRGWNSLGTRSFGLEQLVWTGRMPFEVLSLNATSNGFRLRFTKPLDPVTAKTPGSYAVTSYTYLYHSAYGSPEMDPQTLQAASVEVSPDLRQVTLTLAGLREGYVHEFNLAALRSIEGQPLLHPQAYYTLNQIPE